MAEIIIDNKKYDVASGKNLLETCLTLGMDLPYFCWHPAMGSVGACRQCAIKKYKDEEDEKGKIFMACMEPVQEGVRISVDDPEARKFRAWVIESLMTNHPHDCPTCDEGGECHLQDMTVMTGHVYRRFRFKKRTYRNQYLGPCVHHEMNRCIQCYRCVRFYRDYAGGRDLDAFAAHNHVYFGRYEDGTLENEFSGNLVEVCPTGVFTDKTLKQHYTRKWDLTSAPSICHHCGVGCNILAGERYGSLRRILSRYNGEVNGYFICDRGRYGYEFVNSEKRIRHPLKRNDEGELMLADQNDVLQRISTLLAKGNVIGIGSPRASLESNYTLRRVVGKGNFYAGLSGQESKLLRKAIEILQKGPASSPSLKEIEMADAVLVLGEDLTQTAPMMALALRQSVRQQPMKMTQKLDIPHWHDAAVREAVQDDKGPLYIASVCATKLDDIATQTYHASPDDIARLGFAIAHALHEDAPAVKGLPEKLQKVTQTIADTLKQAERPLIVSGTSLYSEAILEAAANVAWALCRKRLEAKLSFAFPECNSMGLGMIATSRSLDDALERLEHREATVAIVLENDIYRRIEPQKADAFFKHCQQIIALDHIENETTAQADFIFPAGTFAEADGTLVNNEGRAQRFFQVQAAGEATQESWRWLGEMLNLPKNNGSSLKVLDDFIRALVKDMPQFDGIQSIAPPSGFRVAGKKIAREPHRYSGRTAMFANHDVNEPKPPEDPDTPMSFTMEGYQGQPPSSAIPFFWAPGWNSVQSINKYQIEVGGPLHGGDPGRRLIEADTESKVSFFTKIPESYAQQWGNWLVVPLYHIFGSEPMSREAPAIAERAPAPYLLLHPEDANGLEVQEGEAITLEISGEAHKIPVKTNSTLPKGVAGYPEGLSGLPKINLPGLKDIKKA